MADTQLERFSCGFYEESIDDKILLTFIEMKVNKNNRGNELKKMALNYLKEQEPQAYKKLYEEFVQKDKLELTLSINPNAIIEAKRKKKMIKKSEKNKLKIEDLGQVTVYFKEDV